MTVDHESELSEVVNEDWGFQVVHTYALGVELFDLNISATELRLLLILRTRASGGRNNFVSNETLAKDLGVKKNAVAGYMTNLVKQNYVMCKSRGYGAPTLKTIRSMVSRYDQDILQMSRKDLFGSARSDELLERLHHPRPKIDNRPIISDTRSRDSDDIDNSNNSSSTRSDTMEARDRVPLEARDRVIEVDKERDQGEGDSTRFARDARKQNPDQTGEERREVVLPALSSGGTRPAVDDRDAALRFAQDVGVQAAARAARKSQEALEKSVAKKDRDERSGAAAERRRLKEQARIENQTVGGRFYEWAQEEYERFFPKIRMGKWMASEFSQLKALLGVYDNDEVLVRKAWSYCCENWEELTKKLKIADSAPTIGFLLALRSRVFPLVQSQKTDRQAIERQPVKTKIGEW